MRFTIACQNKKEVEQTLRTLADMVLAGLLTDVQIKNLLNPDLETVEGSCSQGKVALQAEFRKRIKIVGE